MFKRIKRVIRCAVMGDCSRRGCGHSIIYHLPFIGCTTFFCQCQEYK